VIVVIQKKNTFGLNIFREVTKTWARRSGQECENTGPLLRPNCIGFWDQNQYEAYCGQCTVLRFVTKTGVSRLHPCCPTVKLGKKSEQMLMRRTKAYGNSSSQVVLVYVHPFRRSSIFCSRKSW